MSGPRSHRLGQDMRPRLRLLYVLPFPELNGGNKVVLQHAELLRRRGHEVTVMGDGPRPVWAPFRGAYLEREAVGPLARQDLVIATYWTTVEVALGLAIGPVAHFCQGYEGDLPHLAAERPAIDEMYSLSLPTLAVTPALASDLGLRFGRECRVAPPPRDSLFRPALRIGPRRRPWIAVPGIFAAPVKGVDTALDAVARLRRRGIRCRMLRFSIVPPSPAEQALLPADRYLCGASPAVVARALRGCDLLLFASRVGEGFGLPLLEALASGVPAVAADIPPARFIADGAAPLVPAGDPEAFAVAAEALLRDRSAWRRARRAGLRAARRFAPQAVEGELDAAVEWAARSARSLAAAAQEAGREEVPC